ncbi:conserved membrane hypothetical protein [uncultured Defluviicoccus sp.]|uniref:O-glycosylation ligase, exosortase A system-associated n=1 Tax=metagenome TaxID=256318 RepID=A0A380T8D5_9ZZZZ|nr:conserved membrane hypothetical protein [uncultured Defluviicoccus sp.]
MRALLFPPLFFFLLALILVSPYAGVLIWGWVAMMNPHQLAGGWISTFPVNSAAVALFVVALFLHREPFIPPANALTILIFVFMIWCMVTTANALSPAISANRADLSFKNMIFCVAVAAATRNRVRCQAMVWVFVLSYGFFSVKGGGFTLSTGGAGEVVGPAKSSIADRNTLAVVMLMTIPLANYLRLTSANRLVRAGLVLLMLLSAVAILGTFSRGGLIGLSFLGAYFWWSSPHKRLATIGILAIAWITWTVMPPRWFDRMSTIETAADTDGSFQGRLDAWHCAFNAASARLTGVGFSGTEDGSVFKTFMPNATVVQEGLAAHSIFFQVLGDHGFIGLALFCAILIAAWRTAGRLSKVAGAENEWIRQFGKAARVALVAYCVASAALSFAYDSSIYCLLGLLSAMTRLASKETETATRPEHGRSVLARRTISAQVRRRPSATIGIARTSRFLPPPSGKG